MVNDFNRINIDIGNVEEKAYKSGDWTLKRVVSRHNTLTYILEGRICYSINGAWHTLTEGDVLFAPIGTEKKGYMPEDSKVFGFSVYFYHVDPSNPLEHVYLPELINVGIDPYLIRLFKDISLLWLEKPFGFHLKARGLFMLILHQIISLNGNQAGINDNRFEPVIRYILQHYNERLTAQKLASIANLNVDYFGTCFKKHTGCNIREYINRIRVNKAQSLLLAGVCNVSEAAYLCGYSDIFYFSKVFKKEIGKSPVEVLKGS